jgi:predicted RNase H-like HicB family nuclease
MAVMTELKPFPVVHGKYLFYFTPSNEGGFSVTCQNVPGVNAQGDTFEGALEHAASMAAFVEDCRREFDAPKRSAAPRTRRAAKK